MTIGFGLSLLLFAMGGWMLQMGVKIVRLERRQQLEEGLETEPFVTITAIIGLAMLYLGLINLILQWLGGLSQPSSLFLILAAFLLEAFAALILAVVTFRLIEKYLPHLVN